jgi:carbamoyltransferase
VRGEPIVGSPEDAYRCFMRTNMDCLMIGNFLLEKMEQKPLDRDLDWLKEFDLD